MYGVMLVKSEPVISTNVAKPERPTTQQPTAMVNQGMAKAALQRPAARPASNASTA
eukprot:CAMPEP_0183417284 /NCGR_PEP_ID=MMETSP0370-20130417/24328_1 /TAXON_ID=268820 /ORGANISM="Peridinium aciculiferum, Strain PAER-2" /LENGTH=55 /DNA_ID=CAMNT_0025600865 /DNA_START=507 /DNA_END=670 /DNA_ORIENTATION=-